MALERGNTDVATAIINRTSNLVLGHSVDWENAAKESPTIVKTILHGLFIGAHVRPLECVAEANGEVPTAFMYLARYGMTAAMDKIIGVLEYLRKDEHIQKEVLKYMIEPIDSNGMNALHYAVLSQSTECVKWFVR